MTVPQVNYDSFIFTIWEVRYRLSQGRRRSQSTAHRGRGVHHATPVGAARNKETPVGGVPPPEKSEILQTPTINPNTKLIFP